MPEAKRPDPKRRSRPRDPVSRVGPVTRSGAGREARRVASRGRSKARPAPEAEPANGDAVTQSAVQLGVVEVDDASRCLAQRDGLVSLADEHGPLFGVGMKSDCCYAASILGIQFADRPNQANGGLAPVYHRNSTWKPNILERVGVKHPGSLCSAAVAEHRIDTCAFAQDFRRVRRRTHRRRGL